MATKRIKDLTNTAASVASDAYLAIDGTSNGTEKITRDNFRQDTADAFVAAPGTYNLAPLSGGAVEVAKGGTGATTAAGARTNLSVNSIDEDAEATGTKLVGPALYFDGSNDYVEIADDAKLSFTDGTDDLQFSVSAWIKHEGVYPFPVLAKFTTVSGEYRLQIDSGGKLQLLLTDGTNISYIISDDSLSSYSGKWVHVAAVYGGAGPNSSAAFTANMSGGNSALYINGQAVNSTPVDSASYTGMVDTAETFRIGRERNIYAKGHIRNVQILNRELSATEVAQLAKGNDLGFADEWGGAYGGIKNADFSAGVDGLTASNGTVDGNIDGIGGLDNNLRFTCNTATAVHRVNALSLLTVGKRYAGYYVYRIPSGQSNVDGIRLTDSLGNILWTGSTLDAWTRVDFDFVAQATGLYFYGLDGVATTFTDAGGDDVFYLNELVITEIGTLADFRAENFDKDTGKLYDISDNAFVGTNNGATLTGRAYPVYETGTWTPSLYYSGTSAATYSAQSGYYTRIGNTVYVRGSISVSGVGASSGSVSVVGLPFTPSSDGASSSIAGCYMTSAANLTSQPIGLVGDGVSQIELYDAGATGNTALDETNITASSVIKVSATYQIQ